MGLIPPIPFVRSPYNYDTTAASDASAYVETMPSLTVQSQAEDTDLNVLMKRFGITGHMPQNVRQPTYGDFTNITDFHSALEALDSAQDSFMQFPAEIRAGFNNDPQLFLDFIENPANIEQTRKWFPQENSGETVRGNRAAVDAVRDGGKAAASAGSSAGDAAGSGSAGAGQDAASGK